MSHRFVRFSFVATLASVTFLHQHAARAADPDDDDKSSKLDKDEKDDEGKDDKDESKAKDEKDSDEAKHEAAASEPTSDADTSPVEKPGKDYMFVGLRYRGVIVPKFMMNIFGQGGRTVYVNGFGPEFAMRKDGFEYNFALWYAAYSMDPTPFKSKSDPIEAWEIVESRVKVLYLTADFLWSQNFSPQVALNYGLGAGLGIVFGDLFRTQAYPGPNANDSTGDGYLPCISQNNPRPDFCGTDNDHYPGFTEKSWFNGGSKPNFFPWLAVQTGLRYKPHKNYVGRLDLGFGTSGFFLGIGADYGL